MAIINDAIRSGKNQIAVGYFADKDFHHSQELSWILSIDEDQVTEYYDEDIVPRQILRILEIWGIFVCSETQKKEGTTLDNLLKLLWEIYKKYEISQVAEAAFFLYSDTVESLYMPSGLGKKHHN